jgi:hypothetical protein
MSGHTRLIVYVSLVSSVILVELFEGQPRFRDARPIDDDSVHQSRKPSRRCSLSAVVDPFGRNYCNSDIDTLDSSFYC